MNQKERLNDIKRKLRELKNLEVKLRFDGKRPAGSALVWDSFFDLSENGKDKAKYNLAMLATMEHEAFGDAINQYWAFVYSQYYKENGIQYAEVFDAAELDKLDLPFDADESEIKRRFRQLAKVHHPDVGGDAGKFIELMEMYKKLINRQ